MRRPASQPRNSSNHKKSSSSWLLLSGIHPLAIALLAFLLGSIVSVSVLLNLHLSSTNDDSNANKSNNNPAASSLAAFPSHSGDGPAQISHLRNKQSSTTTRRIDSSSTSTAVLANLRILVVIVAFDFSQIPHLEEVLDAYHDVAVAGATVHVHIHATVAYPVALMDMWNDRFSMLENGSMELTIVLKPKSLRLHLVDCHRQVFYDNLDNYDLFIYTEDDIRVTPTLVASYWTETRRIQTILSSSSSSKKYKPSDFNVGIVRYEYDYPSNVVMDDNTRHATQNVTRVYWEHSGFERPNIVPNAVKPLEQEPLAPDYISMKNHHQGMYLATAPLLRAWKERCQFDIATNRPGRGSQPTEGTQRVWMSSQMLYGGRHCNVQQVLPKHRFGTLTTLHLPNKNYRRVGKYQHRKFSDGTEVFEKPHSSLLKAMELHLALKRAFSPTTGTKPYKGIRMLDEVDKPRDRTKLLERRMKAFEAYVKRGGILSESDYAHADLIESEDAVGTDDA